MPREEEGASGDGVKGFDAEKTDKRNQDYGKVSRLDKKEPLEICSLTPPPQTKHKSDGQFAAVQTRGSSA